MFAAFLSDDMTYSCPIWLPASEPSSKTEPLDGAQERKLQRFISNARIKPSDHVLEIGTGWGSFAIAAVRKTGCRVTSVTLSTEQKQLAERRIAAAGFTDNIEILLCDYRALPIPKEGPYDKIVSIEMLEAVGREFLKTYFDCVNRLLKLEGGIACFQCITIPEAVSSHWCASYLPCLRGFSGMRHIMRQRISFEATSSLADTFRAFRSWCRPSTRARKGVWSWIRWKTLGHTMPERCAPGIATSHQALTTEYDRRSSASMPV